MKSLIRLLSWINRYKFWTCLLISLIGLGVIASARALTPAKEIALIIGEPWRDMQLRSSAKIADDIPGEIWSRLPEELSYLRFADPEHEFTTPPAKYLSVGFNRGHIDSVRMSPQVEPLPLQEALDVILNLQEQWRKSGWMVTDPEQDPAHENNAHWKEEILKCHAPVTFWHVPDKYQVVVGISCFGDTTNPEKRRFLINFSMGKHRYKPWEYDFPLDPNVPIL